MHDKRSKLNQLLHTVGHTLSPFSCTHFPPSILKLSWQIASLPLAFCWNPISSLMLHNWATNHTKISDFAFLSLIKQSHLSLNLHYWVYDYFTFKYIGKNAKRPPKLWSSDQETRWTFIFANLLLELYLKAKLIHLFSFRLNWQSLLTWHARATCQTPKLMDKGREKLGSTIRCSWEERGYGLLEFLVPPLLVSSTTDLCHPWLSPHGFQQLINREIDLASNLL